MPEYNIGHGSYKVHYGFKDKPNSVKCGNWQEYTKDLSWSDEPALVTCKNCLRRTPLEFTTTAGSEELEKMALSPKPPFAAERKE